MDVSLIQGRGMFADLPAMLQAVLTPPDHPLDPFLGPDHPAVRASAFPADQQLAEYILSAVFPQLRLGFGGCFLETGPAGQLLLHLLEGSPVNDGRMAVMDIVFGQFSVVDPLFSGEQVRDVGFLEEGVTNVFFIAEHLLDHAVMPYRFSGRCFDPIRHQICGDLPDAVSQQKPGEDAPHNGRLFRVDLRLAIRSPAVAEEVFAVVVDLAILEVFPVPPLHIAAEGFTFRLGLAHHEGEDHLVIHEEGVHILFLEVNSHAMPFQAADIVQAIQSVAAEPGYRFGDDKINFATLAVPDHLEKILSLLGRCAGNALIGVEANHRPIRICIDFFRIVFDLGLVTGELLLLIGRHPAVRRDPQVLFSEIPFRHLRVSRDHGDQFRGRGGLLYVHEAHSFLSVWI